MSSLVESLKRLYPDKISLEKLEQMNTNGKLTDEEFTYITTDQHSELDDYKTYYETTQSILPKDVV